MSPTPEMIEAAANAMRIRAMAGQVNPVSWEELSSVSLKAALDAMWMIEMAPSGQLLLGRSDEYPEFIDTFTIYRSEYGLSYGGWNGKKMPTRFIPLSIFEDRK